MALIDEIMQGIGTDGIDTLGRSLGLDARTTSNALGAAVPMLLASLSRNATSPEGAASLLAAIDRNHDGSVFDDIGGYLAGAGAGGDGEKILAHALGSQRQPAARAIGGASGIDTAKAMHLLAMAAPLVLGALGRARTRGQIQPDQLGSYLNTETHSLHQRSSGAMDMISKVLDADHDGSVYDEIASMGAQLFSALQR